MPQLLLTGRTLDPTADQPGNDPHTVFRYRESGGVVIADGVILATGEADELRRQYPQARHIAYGGHLLLPGFVDAHAHYPQTRIIASWGARLLDWLERYTFPEETLFEDAAFARRIAETYLDRLMDHGTTTVASYCTIHPASVDAIFAAACARGMRVVAGKTCMDRNAPAGLRDSPQSAHDDSRALIQRWHGQARLTYAITPRFAPTSSPEQLEALGSLWRAYPDCLVQTHLSEQTDEVAWVRTLYPNAADYLGVYQQFGLAGPRAIFGHAIHLEPRERDSLAEAGAAVAHCPTSNSFIGSGIFDLAGIQAHKIPVALATDTGGGSSYSMLRTMAAAYELAQLRGHVIHPSTLLWLATRGSARALHLDTHIGRLAPGYEADITVVDLASTPDITARAQRADDIWDAVFATIMLGDDRAIAATWIAGKQCKPGGQG